MTGPQEEAAVTERVRGNFIEIASVPIISSFGHSVLPAHHTVFNSYFLFLRTSFSLHSPLQEPSAEPAAQQDDDNAEEKSL